MGNKLNTNNFAADGALVNVSASLLNFGGGLFSHIDGYINPILGSGAEITSMTVWHAIRDAQYHSIAVQMDSSVYLSVVGNQIHFASNTAPGWIQFGEGYVFWATFQVFYTENGVAKNKVWDAHFYGIPLNPPQIPGLTVTASIDPMPAKPIHKVSVSCDITPNGATIVQRKIWINGQQVAITGTDPFTASINFSDNTPPINYTIVGEIQYSGVVFGVTVTWWKSVTAYISYEGELS